MPRNVETEIVDDTLIIKVKMHPENMPRSGKKGDGKTFSVATTNGFLRLNDPDDTIVSLNVNRYPPQ